MMVRRDLEEPSARKLLRKVHGGAVPAPKAAAEPHFAEKQRLNRAEKRAIARAALGFVNDGERRPGRSPSRSSGARSRSPS